MPAVRATSLAWQVPHTDRPPAFQAVLAVVSAQGWLANFLRTACTPVGARLPLNGTAPFVLRFGAGVCRTGG